MKERISSIEIGAVCGKYLELTQKILRGRLPDGTAGPEDPPHFMVRLVQPLTSSFGHFFSFLKTDIEENS